MPKAKEPKLILKSCNKVSDNNTSADNFLTIERNFRALHDFVDHIQQVLFRKKERRWFFLVSFNYKNLHAVGSNTSHTIIDYIRPWQNIGIEEHKTQIMSVSLCSPMFFKSVCLYWRKMFISIIFAKKTYYLKSNLKNSF